jgi:hypothetical protein
MGTTVGEVAGLQPQLVISAITWLIAVFSLQGVIYPNGVPQVRNEAQGFFFVACPAYMFFFCVCAGRVLWRNARRRAPWATAMWIAVLAAAQYAPWTITWAIPALGSVLLFTVSNLKRAGPVPSDAPPPTEGAAG